MKILLGIIFFHLLVIMRSKMSEDEKVPYVTTFFISLLIVAYVVFMMFNMEDPTPDEF